MTEKTFFITGASTGIGRATAELAAAQGYGLALLARSEDKLRSLADGLEGDALTLPCDVTDAEAVRRAADRAAEHFGRIDVVFANAGTGGEPGGFSGAPPESWQRLLMTNVYGLAVTLRATAEHVKRAAGHVVITSSIAGRRSLAGSMYSASKWAATGIGHGFRKEMTGSGVRVTLIEPGMVNTPFFDEPKSGVLEPGDVARAVLYAVSQPAHVEIHELTILPTSASGDSVP